MTSLGTRTGQTIGHFYIDEKLGEGGMGAVYLGEDLTLSRRVAIKFLNRHQLVQQGNESMREATEQRFIREAKSAAAINHPNIAQIYEANFDTGEWYIAMEFIDGSSLHDHIEEGRKFSIDEIIQICQQTANGLDYAWKKYKIIHRDIKPHNIMLTNDHQVKIVDLGLAKPLESEFDDFELPELTNAGTPVGTPHYMAPEQAAGKKDINYLVDIYALGATLYELCSGQKAFDEKTAPMIYMAQIQKKYRPVREFNYDLPDAFIQLIESMLEPKPEDRISSYADVLEALNTCSRIATELVESEIEKSVSFPCPNCSVELSIGTEYLGAEIECPQCQFVFEVPQLDEAPLGSGSSLPHAQQESVHDLTAAERPAAEQLHGPILETFTNDDTTLLKEDYGADLDTIGRLQREHCWEFGVIAEILMAQINALRHLTSDGVPELFTQSGWKQDRGHYYAFVKEHCQKFFSYQKRLYNLMREDLQYALFGDDLTIIFSFGKKVRNLADELREFQDKLRAEPVPQDKLSTDIQRVMADSVAKGLYKRFFHNSIPMEDQHSELHINLSRWVPYCCDRLRKFSTKLKEYETKDRHSVGFEFRYSFIPPTLFRFYSIAKSLEMDLFNVKSVKANVVHE